MESCYCDPDTPEFYRTKRPKAVRIHRCCECGRIIEKGERYEYAAGKWGGAVNSYKTCAYCLAVIDMLNARLRCFCRWHSGLYEELDAWRGELPPGLAFAIGRVLVECRQDRRRQQTEKTEP